ncbi:hypothetical protein NQD34_017659 [Periophthalmus magnuspinnatus]|nr:hypothetical protein NQD34_017659 [Periophthalmus magnuspinnatus]
MDPQRSIFRDLSNYTSDFEPNSVDTNLTNSSFGNSSQAHIFHHSLWEEIAIATVSAIVSLITIVGNVLVLVSFKVNSQLKTVNNYYLLSLACADLIIGVLSMNLYTTYILMGYWSLGNIACDLWLAVDYAINIQGKADSEESSHYDRHGMDSVVRSLGSSNSLLAVFSWQAYCAAGSVPNPVLTEPVITFGTAIAAFYIPVSVMTILYCRIYKETQKRTKDLAELQGLTSGSVQEGVKPQKTPIHSCFHFTREKADRSQASWSSSNQSNATKTTTRSEEAWTKSEQVTTSFNSYTSSEEDEHHVSMDTPQGSFKDQNRGSKNGQVVDYGGDEQYFSSPSKQNCKKGIAYKFKLGSRGKDSSPEPSPRNTATEQAVKNNPSPSSSTTSKPIDPNMKNQITKRKRMVLVKEKKAAQTLSAILLAFILTWTPYNIMVLISTFCGDCIPTWLWHLGYWLCYVNSTINPMCYALCNKTFQKTFKMLLLCQYRRRRCKEKLYWGGQNAHVNNKVT